MTHHCMILITSMNNFLISSEKSEQYQQESHSCTKHKISVPCTAYNSAEQILMYTVLQSIMSQPICQCKSIYGGLRYFSSFSTLVTHIDGRTHGRQEALLSCFIPVLHRQSTRKSDYHEPCADPYLEQQKDESKLEKSCCTGGSIITTDLHSSIPKLLILNIYKCVTNEIVICKVFFQLSSLINQ